MFVLTGAATPDVDLKCLRLQTCIHLFHMLLTEHERIREENPQEVMHFNLVEFVKGVQEHIGGLDSFALNWDPGCYSGRQWVLGLIYSVETGVCAPMPPKVEY